MAQSLLFLGRSQDTVARDAWQTFRQRFTSGPAVRAKLVRAANVSAHRLKRPAADFARKSKVEEDRVLCLRMSGDRSIDRS